MNKIEYTITFKDGLKVEQNDEFPDDSRSDFFYGFSQGFKNNADITINNDVKRKFDDIKSVEINLD